MLQCKGVDMSFSNFDIHTRELFWGNVLLMVCSLFYLAWWIVAFKPNGAAKEIITGPLLAAAMMAGIIAVVLTIMGINTIPHEATLLPMKPIIWGGVAAYFILLAITYFLFKRQVTSELLLIVGWAMLELSVINVLYGAGRFGMKTAIVLFVAIGIAVVISLVSYVLYYRLEENSSYIDGMIPLIIETLVMAGISVSMLA